MNKMYGKRQPSKTLQPVPLLTKWRDIIPQDVVKSRRCEIRVQTFPSGLKFDTYIGSSAEEMSG